MTRLPLTPRQSEVLESIRSYIREKGYPPTIREIGERVGLHSTNRVTELLQVLEHKGWLRNDHAPRALCLLA